MRQKPPRATFSRIRKLARIASELSEGANFSITRLTSLKSLCEEPEVAAHFAVYLVSRAGQRAARLSSPLHLSDSEWAMHDELVQRAVEQLGSYVERPSDPKREALRELLRELESVNDEYKPVPYGMVRVIRNRYVLILENAVQCVLLPHSAPNHAYHLARNYTERYDPRYGMGLIPESAPLVMDIVDFWCEYYSIDRDEL